MTCIGCELANNRENNHTILQDNNVRCILDYSPYNEGHVLILPKKHVRYFHDLDNNTGESTLWAAKKVSEAINDLYQPNGITIMQNGGAFDDLTHFHMHVIPRYEGQNFTDFFREDEDIESVSKIKLEKTRNDILDYFLRKRV